MLNNVPVISTPTIYNITLTNANTQYSQALPANCRKFEIQCLTASDVRIAFVTGKVATPTAPYAVVKSGQRYSSPEHFETSAPLTVYLASAQAGVVAEILAWT